MFPKKPMNDQDKKLSELWPPISIAARSAARLSMLGGEVSGLDSVVAQSLDFGNQVSNTEPLL